MRTGLLFLLSLATSCKTAPNELGSSAAASVSATATAASTESKVEILVAPDNGTDVDVLVKDEMARAAKRGRKLLVYVGATWCEPCQRFHHAAQQGELDRVFPTLTFLAFDLDRDRERLQRAGYQSKLIPLFALPDKEGRGTGRAIEGSIKGDGAVAEITPRLKALIAD